jgi:vesicle-fusing ATPase
VRNPIVDYGKNFGNILSMLNKASKLALGDSRQLVSLLMYGKQGSGKTTIASHFAKVSKFNFIKLITPEKYVGIGSMGKINNIYKVFNDAYKSSSSLIVIDNI